MILGSGRGHIFDVGGEAPRASGQRSRDTGGGSSHVASIAAAGPGGASGPGSRPVAAARLANPVAAAPLRR